MSRGLGDVYKRQSYICKSGKVSPPKYSLFPIIRNPIQKVRPIPKDAAFLNLLEKTDKNKVKANNNDKQINI